MIAVYDTPVCNVVTDIESPQEFNLTHLNELKSEIIWFVLRQGHFPFPSIIFLKKTDGLKYYDPLQDIHSRNISAQDLINLNSGGPLNYKKTPIKIGFMLQAYIYDADNLGFLRPDQSEIKVISIESVDYVEMGSIISCTIEIQPISGGHCFPYSGEKRGEPVIKTIKYANL